MTSFDPEQSAVTRSSTRGLFTSIMIVTATALAFGAMSKTDCLIGANDISRWCTVWSLLERGTYAIDECPWQARTQDKVRMPEPFAAQGATPRMRFYSSKPPLLPTMIAGVLYPFRAVSGVPLDAVVEQKRLRRLAVESLDYQPKENQKVVETNAEYKIIDITGDPVKWNAYLFYFDPALALLNIVPFAVFLVLYARLLDRYATNDWAFMASLTAAALGTNLTLFLTTLNNHTVAAFSAFFALWAFLKIWCERSNRGGLFIAVGFFSAFAACTELPALALSALLFAILLLREPRATLTRFLPAALVPYAAFFITQYLATGGFSPVYAEFKNVTLGSPYYYEGSYWLTPLAMDKLDEPKWTYLFHMTLGHHGVFSLTPVFLFAFWGWVRCLRERSRVLAVPALGTMLLTLVVGGFYFLRTTNYGGSTQGLRWLFWLFPLWLLFLPVGLESGQDRPWLRRLGLAALAVSVFNTGYGLMLPWSHPWYLDLIEHFGLYTLDR